MSPNNGTALRDSILLATKVILQMYSKLNECDLVDDYFFVHIVLTDGADT